MATAGPSRWANSKLPHPPVASSSDQDSDHNTPLTMGTNLSEGNARNGAGYSSNYSSAHAGVDFYGTSDSEDPFGPVMTNSVGHNGGGTPSTSVPFMDVKGKKPATYQDLLGSQKSHHTVEAQPALMPVHYPAIVASNVGQPHRTQEEIEGLRHLLLNAAIGLDSNGAPIQRNSTGMPSGYAGPMANQAGRGTMTAMNMDIHNQAAQQASGAGKSPTKSTDQASQAHTATTPPRQVVETGSSSVGGFTTPSGAPGFGSEFYPRHVHGRSLTIDIMDGPDELVLSPPRRGLPVSSSDGNLDLYGSTGLYSRELVQSSAGRDHVQPNPTAGSPIRNKVVLSPVYGPLNFAPVPDSLCQLRSFQLNNLAGFSGRPTLEALLHPCNIPFVETCRLSHPVNYGVVHISNIPYDTTRAEVIAFLGRNSRILNDVAEPVHIIMDRVTSKTNDCYVEFMTFQDATNAVEKFRNAIEEGRTPRIGRRNVDVELSSQAHLQKELFPAAHGVDWNVIPHSIKTDSVWSWDNFKGFVSEEEMIMLEKHADSRQRSAFSARCPQRAFECMISTIKKLPWYMPERITIKQRWIVYDAAFKMIQVLIQKLDKKPDDALLTPQLLNRLVDAAILCPGFTVLQKDNIAYTMNMSGEKMCERSLPRFAASWCHQYALGPKPGVPLDILEYYIALIREETHRVSERLSLSRLNELSKRSEDTSKYWGWFWCEVGYPTGQVFDNMNLSEVAGLEWRAVEKVLRRAVSGGKPPSY
ncbi:hypothetical protein AAE478_008514 [Parahypoxylon ruwenzoriense]